MQTRRELTKVTELRRIRYTASDLPDGEDQGTVTLRGRQSGLINRNPRNPSVKNTIAGLIVHCSLFNVQGFTMENVS
jgi:hypothetical protein